MNWTKLQCGLVRKRLCQTDLVSIFEKVLPERLLRENTLDSKTPDILNLKRISVCAKSLQLCTAVCDPMDCSPSDSSVHGILQARILEWVAMPSSRGSSQPRDRTRISYVSYALATVCLFVCFFNHYDHLGNPITHRSDMR